MNHHLPPLAQEEHGGNNLTKSTAKIECLFHSDGSHYMVLLGHGGKQKGYNSHPPEAKVIDLMNQRITVSISN